MSAILRAYGTTFDIDAFIADSPLLIINVFRRGEPKFPKSKPAGDKWSKSGLNVEASKADFDAFSSQVGDAIIFLKAYGAEIKRLVAFQGVEQVGLDFAISRREVVVQCDSFPADLIRLAGECGIALDQSHYPAIDGEPTVE